MIAAVVNTVTVLIGSTLGLLLRSRFRESLQDAVMKALALCTILIGMSSALKTEDSLCVILCMALGTLLGETLRIEKGINAFGDRLKRRFSSGGDRFTEGFVTACILFCIGSMTIVGCLEAGLQREYSTIFAKSTLDLFSSFALASAMGAGVVFSAAFVLVFQGALTLLAGWIGPALSAAAVNEMSAVGGVILLGLGINLLGLGEKPIRVANMLPAIFLPIVYLPLASFLARLLG